MVFTYEFIKKQKPESYVDVKSKLNQFLQLQLAFTIISFKYFFQATHS